MEALKLLNAKEGEYGLSKVEISERAVLRSQIQNLLSLEEVSWRQKQRMLCIKEGANNTKFFHKVANSRRRYNHISMLEVNGVIFVDWCIMCRCNGETVDHLLLHCSKAYRLWSLVFRSFGIS